MKQTKVGSLVSVAVVAIPIGWSIGRIFDAATDTLPPVPWVLPLLLVFLAVFAWAAAHAVHDWVRERRYDARLDALRVARLLVLAKAAEYFGAAVAGAYLGLGVLALDSFAVPMGRNRAVLSAFVIVAAVVVTVAAIRLERACVVPPEDDDHGGDGENGGRPVDGRPA